MDAFLQRLHQLGWRDGGTVQIDVRWSGADPKTIRRNASELVDLAPDVILAPGSATVGPLLQVTDSVPVVFTVVPDPVGAGFVDSFLMPGGNATGFASFEYGLGAKWLELLKEIAPGINRVAVLRDPSVTAGIGQWTAIQAAAPSFGVTASPINLRDESGLERAIIDFAQIENGGLIVTSCAASVRHRNRIVQLAAEHRLPALYYAKAFVTGGGLISYGPDRMDQFRRAAGYVDRILNGEKPSDLPVLASTRYELIVNLSAATALNLTVPKPLLVRSDEIIE
jgi:putative ABC transport system substrate-binding protein